jgi:hypothetical protein
VEIAVSKALYVAYLTGQAGNSLGLFYIGDGSIYGIDVGLVRYEGQYSQHDRHSPLVGSVEMILPEMGQLITGAPLGAGPTRFPIRLELAHDFANGDVIRIDTMYGPVNARFEKVQELP